VLFQIVFRLNIIREYLRLTMNFETQSARNLEGFQVKTCFKRKVSKVSLLHIDWISSPGDLLSF